MRWLAALGVYIFHFGNPAWFPNELRNLQSNGSLGVQFFFVLSGYVLTHRYFHNYSTHKRYLLARLARIGPLYVLGLISGLLATLLTSSPLNLKLLGIHAIGLQSWSSDFGNVVAFNGPGWTISVEFFFYVTFALLIRRVNQANWNFRKALLLIFTGTLLGFVLTVKHLLSFGAISQDLAELPNEFIWVAFAPVVYVGLFITGIGSALLGRLLIERPKAPRIILLLHPNLLIVIFGMALTLLNLNSPEDPLLVISTKYWLLGIPVGAFLLGFQLHEDCLLGRIVGSDTMLLLGRISYSFYIFHVPVTRTMQQFIPQFTYEGRFAVLLTISYIAYRLIEVPSRERILHLLRKS